MKNHNSLPIEFEQIKNVLDSRFTKVKIWIAHTGENRNNSIFSKEVLESMIPSLTNTMILGYIAVDENGDSDFKAHESRLVIENGEFNFKYVGRAWGLIPESHNAHFELRYGEDGVEREYLVCEGILWNKFPEVEEIFDRDGGYKSQSMELFPPSVKGYVNEFGQFVFTEAKFEGACILGEDVTPAMISSTIEKFSAVNNVKAEFSEMLTEFNAYFSTTQEKGDYTMPDENNLTVEQETVEANQAEVTEYTEAEVTEGQEVTDEVTADTTEFTETEVAENTEATTVEVTTEAPATEPAKPETDFAEKEDEEDEEEDEKEDPEEEDEKPKKFTLTFELAHDDIRSGLYQAIEGHEQFKDSWVWISKVYDSHAIVADESNDKFYKMNYVKHENAVSLGEFEEIFPMWVNSTEKQVIEIARNSFSKFEELEGEVKELREFKSNSELAEKEAKLTSYSNALSKEEYKTIQDNLANFSMTDIEKEIGFMLLKKNHFSASNETAEVPSRVSAVPTEGNFGYGTLTKYFTK